MGVAFGDISISMEDWKEDWKCRIRRDREDESMNLYVLAGDMSFV